LLELRLSLGPSTGLPAKTLQQQHLGALKAISLLSTLDDDVRELFASSTELCSALVAYVGDSAADGVVQQAAVTIGGNLLRCPAATSQHMLPTWTGNTFMRALLQMVAFRNFSSDDAEVIAAAQHVGYEAAIFLCIIARAQLAARNPPSIAAQPSAAASIVSGMRFCLSRIESGSTPDGTDLADTINTLTMLCNVMGAVALAEPPGASTWASVMLRMAPMRALTAQLTGGWRDWQSLNQGDRRVIACGLYAVAVRHGEVVRQQQADEAALIKDCLETATSTFSACCSFELRPLDLLFLHLPLQRLPLAKVQGMLGHLVRQATSDTTPRDRAVGIQLLYMLAAHWLEQQHRERSTRRLLPPPEFVNRACPGCGSHIDSDWYNCTDACAAPDRLSALKAAEVPLRVLPRATDPELATQAALALAALLMPAALPPQHEAAACAACSKTAADGVELQQCLGCSAVWFCGQDCQRADWRSPTGHKAACKAAQELGALQQQQQQQQQQQDVE